MTIKEKAIALDEMCADTACRECPLFSWKCVQNCDFLNESLGGWTDDLIEKAYDVVFNQPTPTTGGAVDHPSHYNREGARECIYEMVLIFGIEETMTFCKLNAWKYRYRAADKGGLEDLKKSDWYIRMYEKLKDGEVL